MTTDITSMAVRALNGQADRAREALARDARALAADLLRFADDIDTGLATGGHSRIAQNATQFLIAAVDLRAKADTTSIFDGSEK